MLQKPYIAFLSLLILAGCASKPIVKIDTQYAIFKKLGRWNGELFFVLLLKIL
mgnify:FL=1